MINIIETFKRLEKKYLLTEKEYDQLLDRIYSYIEKDKYFESKISTIYFDTDNYDLIRKSVDKPLYKEKVRLRSYGIPKENDNVFFEIKKKYKGMCNKRRIIVKYIDIKNYLNNNIVPICNTQIIKEIDYCMKFYKLKPVLYLAYDRNSYYEKNNKNFRLTFDINLRFKTKNLFLDDNSKCQNYFDEKIYIMEIKTLDSIPLWFVKVLSDLKIYPTSFSKYGSIYLKHIIKESELC